MTPDEINEFYLRVGANAREDDRRGPYSRDKERARMGRKGIGKLAPFGICKTIEVQTAGEENDGDNFRVAHFVMNFDDINQETDEPYHPEIVSDDGTLSQKRGTIIKLRNFYHRRTPDEETFHRQIARSFGTKLPDFKIKIENTENGNVSEIGELDVEIEEETKINVDDRPPVTMEDGTTLPVKGWVAYTKHPYKNEEVAGVRIYTRGKIGASTRDFGLKAGFTGEHTLRSYLAGVIHAEWLDKDDGEDLVHTGRQDILWASEEGTAFMKWGQQLLKELATKSRTPLREKAWRVFLERSNLEEEAKERFHDKEVVKQAMVVGKVIGQVTSLDDLTDESYTQKIKELVLTITPHKMLVDKLKEVEEKGVGTPLGVISAIFNDAKVAEASSLGQVAMVRIDIVDKLEQHLQSGASVDESALQKLIESASWLVDPRWTVLQANKSFETLRSAFETWYRDQHGTEITTTTLSGLQRPDFVMMHVGRGVEIVEIKRPRHALIDEEFERLRSYIGALDRFLEANPNFKEDFPKVHATLICDSLRLGATPQLAYDKLKDDRKLKKKTWWEILQDTKKVNQDFLDARSPSE